MPTPRARRLERLVTMVRFAVELRRCHRGADRQRFRSDRADGAPSPGRPLHLRIGVRPLFRSRSICSGFLHHNYAIVIVVLAILPSYVFPGVPMHVIQRGTSVRSVSVRMRITASIWTGWVSMPPRPVLRSCLYSADESRPSAGVVDSASGVRFDEGLGAALCAVLQPHVSA